MSIENHPVCPECGEPCGTMIEDHGHGWSEYGSHGRFDRYLVQVSSCCRCPMPKPEPQRSVATRADRPSPSGYLPGDGSEEILADLRLANLREYVRQMPAPETPKHLKTQPAKKPTAEPVPY
jgi:hypothetical protein